MENLQIKCTYQSRKWLAVAASSSAWDCNELHQKQQTTFQPRVDPKHPPLLFPHSIVQMGFWSGRKPFVYLHVARAVKCGIVQKKSITLNFKLKSFPYFLLIVTVSIIIIKIIKIIIFIISTDFVKCSFMTSQVPQPTSWQLGNLTPLSQEISGTSSPSQ